LDKNSKIDDIATTNDKPKAPIKNKDTLVSYNTTNDDSDVYNVDQDDEIKKKKAYTEIGVSIAHKKNLSVKNLSESHSVVGFLRKPMKNLSESHSVVEFFMEG